VDSSTHRQGPVTVSHRQAQQDCALGTPVAGNGYQHQLQHVLDKNY